MIVTFDKEYLRELYERGKGDKKHRFQPDIVKRYQKRIDTLKRALNIEELFNNPFSQLRSVERRQGWHFIHKGK